MKNKQEILGLITNIVLVSLIFCFIVAGLNIIGIYSLPAPIEKLLGTYEGDESFGSGVDSTDLNFANFDENAPSFKEIDLGFESAFAVLSSLSPRDNYAQKVKVVHSYENAQRIENFDIVRNNSLYTVTVSDWKSGQVKKITQDDEQNVTVTEVSYENNEPALVRNGNFDISEECGFVLTAREFLESGYNLTDADFEKFFNDKGAFVSVEFDYPYNNVILRQKYVFSLDFGVVTEVKTYENGTLVYDMTTSFLSENE